MPPGEQLLYPHIWYGGPTGNISDVFTAKIDTTTLLTIHGADAAGVGYALNTWDVSAFADGGNHTIQFQLQQLGARASAFNVHVDDVALSNPGASGAPEPATFALGAAGLVAIFAVRCGK